MTRSLPTGQKTRWRGYLLKILLALLSVVVALGLSELIVRLIFSPPTRMQFVPDPIVGFRHAPNQRVWMTNEAQEFGVWFTTNSQGDPDIERSVDKPEGVYRIAVIGDSIAEATQVRQEERFTSLLEWQLTEWSQRRLSSIQQVEVLNFGTSSYGTAQEWLYYQSHVRNYDPDMVLLVFLPGNDIRNNSFQLEIARAGRSEIMPFFSLSEADELILKNKQFYANAVEKYTKSTSNTTGLRDVYKKVRDQVRLIGIIHQAYAEMRARANGESGLSDQAKRELNVNLELFNPEVQQKSDEWQQAWELTGAILSQFAQDVVNDGAEFYVIVASGPLEVNEETREIVLQMVFQGDESAEYDWRLPHSLTEAMLTRYGLSYTNLFPAIETASREHTEPMHFIRDGHYTPAGHRVVAAELLPVVQSYISNFEDSRLDASIDNSPTR